MNVDWNFVLECILRLSASVVCGFLLGIERKSRRQIVGMRTLILICVSCTLLAIVSYYMALNFGEGHSDVTRISAGVVSGIGFLGGGAILRQGLNIKGLTSAAIIWTASALGLAIGIGLYIQSAFVLASVLTLLIVLEKIEAKWFPAIHSKELHLMFEEADVDMKEIKKVLQKNGFVISDVNISRIIANNQIIIRYSVKSPKEEDFSAIISELKTIGKLAEFSITS